jgi:hypothetical protein
MRPSPGTRSRPPAAALDRNPRPFELHGEGRPLPRGSRRICRTPSTRPRGRHLRRDADRGQLPGRRPIDHRGRRGGTTVDAARAGVLGARVPAAGPSRRRCRAPRPVLHDRRRPDRACCAEVAVHPYRLGAPFEALTEVRQYQIVQHDNRLEVLIVPRAAAPSDIAARVQAALAETSAEPSAAVAALTRALRRQLTSAGRRIAARPVTPVSSRISKRCSSSGSAAS